MKYLFASLVLSLTTSLFADTTYLGQSEVIELHPEALEGAVAFVKANGFDEYNHRYGQQQQQQQPNYPQTGCYVVTTTKGYWNYKENFISKEVLAVRELVSSRTDTAGFSVKDNQLSSLLENTKSFSFSCSLVATTWSQGGNRGQRQVIDSRTDAACLKSCEDNGSYQCVEKCTEYVYGPGETCEEYNPEVLHYSMNCTVTTAK